MDTINQQTINFKMLSLMENLHILLNNTLSGSNVYIMNENINFAKITYNQYIPLIFENELFDILIANKYAINNNTVDDANSGITFANSEYPFSLIICSKDAQRSSILVNNVGLLLIKYILYLRMLNQVIAKPNCVNCLLAINMKLLPFGRICIDVDYIQPVFNNEHGIMSDDEYESFIRKCFHIVCDFTTFGSIIMTQNLSTSNTRSFHLITEQQFDYVTREIIFLKISEEIKKHNPNIKIDQVHVWMLPFGRGHVPVRKFNRKDNVFKELNYPYTEVDFELIMPFDLNMGLDNMYTLFKKIDNVENMEYDVLNEYMDNEITASYYIYGTNDIHKNLQLFSNIVLLQNDFAFGKQYKYRFDSNFLEKILCNKYNNCFLIVSNKKMMFENNWEIPKPKIKQRPTEFYEIYRFINAKLLNNLQNIEELFKIMPANLVSRNVNIGNTDEISNENPQTYNNTNTEEKCREVNTKNYGDFELDLHKNTISSDFELYKDVQSDDSNHPWAYMSTNDHELTPMASTSMKYISEYFRNTIANNVYPYEKRLDEININFKNLQTILTKDSKYFCKMFKQMYVIIMQTDVQKIQNYIFHLYEFFCRVHYIDACIDYNEYTTLRDTVLKDTLGVFLSEEFLDTYRRTYVEMLPGKMAYKKFPQPGTPFSTIWPDLDPEHKIFVHIIYLMIVEHNYTSIFMYMHSIFKTNKITYFMCSLFLNIIDISYTDKNTNLKVTKYASKEFLNFIYKTFIDGGSNVKCTYNDGNINFDMINLQNIIPDMQLMFIASPMWYFLSNFQYIDENIDVITRFDLLTQIFQQPQIQGAHTANANNENNRNQRQNDSATTGPPNKKMKVTKTSINHDYYFKMYNIQDNSYQNDILAIFYKYIVTLCKTESGEYLFDGKRFCPSTLNVGKIKPRIIQEPVKHSLMYRLQYGIYNTWTMQFERNISVLYTNIDISNDDFEKYPEIFNAYNDKIYKIIVNRYLKSITFTRILNYQKNLGLLLAPIYDPNIETVDNKVLNYNIDSIQINIHDLSSSEFILPEEMLRDVLQVQNKLYEMFKWLYAIICHYSENFSCKIMTPSSFIPKCMIPETKKEGDINTDSELTYSFFQQHIMDNHRYTNNNENNNRGAKLIQRIHKILNSKDSDQQRHMTDALQKLSEREMRSLVVLFNNLYANGLADDVSDEKSSDSDSNSQTSSTSSNNTNINTNKNDDDDLSKEEICKFNLSTQYNNTSNKIDTLNFFHNEEYLENSKIKLLRDLFNRKLSNEIMQMSTENFKSIIEENFSQHITRFVLLILSWFIRTIHTHVFSDTIFFQQIQEFRQVLYNELSNLTFKHNGYFIYNNSIVDVVNIFRNYCRNVCINVEPEFELKFPISEYDLYLNYNSQFENQVSIEIINDIEAGCVSSIYQGQFIENTNVDLCRLWARATIPRNKHRISPLFNLHTATGKSEYLTEKCRSQFNNKYHNNFLDSTSLKSNDRGIDMARELNSNLIVCIEEFTNLTEKFKQICGHSSITYKPLWADTKSSFQNNATVILATNNDPKCTEAAVIARLHVFPRRIQYSLVNTYLKFQRTSIVSTATLLNINNIFTVQLIMEKMPRIVAENARGNFMMTWILKRFFLYNILDPITIQTSETLQNHIDNFHNMINAPQLVLERLELNTGEMTLFQFRKLVNRICDENRNLFNSKIDTYNVFTILSDKLKVMINNNTQTIRVSEKNIK